VVYLPRGQLASDVAIKYVAKINFKFQIFFKKIQFLNFFFFLKKKNILATWFMCHVAEILNLKINENNFNKLAMWFAHVAKIVNLKEKLK
jgi:hypothetical protein